jgi:hypothetical protein
MLLDDDYIPNCHNDAEEDQLCLPGYSGSTAASCSPMSVNEHDHWKRNNNKESASSSSLSSASSSCSSRHACERSKSAFWVVDAEEETLRKRCLDELKVNPRQDQTAPIQLPAGIYTRSAGIRWEANLEFAEDKYGEEYGPGRQRAVYVIRITGAVREMDGLRLEQHQLPTHLQYLVNADKNYVVAFPTLAVNLIKGVGINCSESGWDAWRFACNNKPLKIQKRCRVKKDRSVIKHMGGGFVNPTNRSVEQLEDYLVAHPHIRATVEQVQNGTVTLPPVTHQELRDWWWNRCDERGSAGRVCGDKDLFKASKTNDHKTKQGEHVVVNDDS